MNRRRGEAAGGNIQRNVPPMIQPGSESEADLAYDLRPHVKRGIGVFPRGVWERRPAVWQIAHSGLGDSVASCMMGAPRNPRAFHGSLAGQAGAVEGEAVEGAEDGDGDVVGLEVAAREGLK